jgi:transcriptional regulator with XRE-family HTH domain/tetratricopeptide (TPR) repeat protein
MVNSNGKPPLMPPPTAAASGKQTTGPTTDEFGSTVRRLRNERNLTQEQLAEKAGISVEAISKIERGLQRQPRKDTVQLLANALALAPLARAAFETAAGYPQQEEDPIGREREWTWLRREFAGDRPMFMISGGPGIGKSHLLGAAARWAIALGWQVLLGGCHRSSGQEPYAPITEAIKQSIRLLPHEHKIEVLSGCAWLTRLLPELLDEGVLEAPRQTLSSVQERLLMFDSVVRYLENVGGEAGTLLVLDDLQWAGADTVLLLIHLIRCARPGRIRILAAYRTTEVGLTQPLAVLIADLAKDDHVAQVELEPLALDDATRLAGNLLRPLLEHTDALAGRELVQGLAERTHRIPLFLVHFAKSLQELALEREARAARDAIPSGRPPQKMQDMRISVADLDRVPWSIAQHVQQRVAALPPSARALVEVAAVAEEATPGEVLAECLGRSEREALPDFEAACASGLLVARMVSGGRVAYSFEHDLVHEAVDGMLSAERTMLLHRALGAALERRLGDNWRQREDLFPVLAHHFAHSGQPEKAATHLRLAGDQARRAFAHEQAARYYAELVACLDELAREGAAADARRNLAEELAHIGRYTEAVETLAQAGDIYQALGDVESLAMVVADIASAHTNRGAVSAGLAELLPIVENLSVSRPGEHEAATTLSPAIRTWLLGTLAHLYFMDERYDEALQTAEQSLDVAQATENSALIGRAHLECGVALFVLGRTPEAAEILQLAITCLETASSRELVLQALLMAIWVAQTQGDFPRSRDLQQRALVEAQDFGDPAIIGQAFIFVGLLAFYTGDWGLARTLAMSSANALGEVESSAIGSYPPLGLGILCLVSGEREEAMRHLDLARVIAARSDGKQVLRLIEALLAEDELVHDQGAAACDRLAPLLASHALEERTRIELQTLYAWGLLQLGALAEAEALTLQAVQGARDHAMGLLLPDALRVRALCAIERQEWLVATDALEQAIALCAQMPYPYAEAKARYVYGQLWLAISEPVRARKQFEQALAICDRLGERLYGAVIEKAFEKVERLR